MIREFICLDCGVPTRSVGEDAANEIDLCGPCRWLREIEDPAERERIRAMTHRRDMG